MAGIVVYALHDDEGNFNKNSLGAISEAKKLADQVGGDAAAVVVGDVSDDAAASLGNYGAAKVHRAKDVPEGLAQPIVDVMAKVIEDEGYSSEPGIIIGRLNAFDTEESGGTAEVADVDVELSPWSSKATMVERGEQRGADVNIEDADILVAGGRGLGKAENFDLCEQLASALGGAVAATRAVVDAGWF